MLLLFVLGKLFVEASGYCGIPNFHISRTGHLLNSVRTVDGWVSVWVLSNEDPPRHRFKCKLLSWEVGSGEMKDTNMGHV